MQHKKNNNKKFLSLIVQSYSYGKETVADIRRIIKPLQDIKIPYEIIFVADGDLNKRKKIFLRRRIPHLKVVGYNTRHGKGYAVRFGMANAKGSIIAFLDVGMGLYPKDIETFLHIMQAYNADIVIGSKLLPGSKVIYPWQRKFLSWGYRLITKILFGLSVRDTQVGFKIFHRSVLEDVLPRLLVKQYAFDIEILAVAQRLGYTKIYEAPITFTFHNWLSLSSKNFWEAILRTMWDTFAVFYRLKILKYYDTVSGRKWKYDPELNFRINIP